MTFSDVDALLEANKNERGMQAWEKVGNPAFRSYGLGLTQIKKLAKGVTKSQPLADELWRSDLWDAKQLACLVGEPKTLSSEALDTMAAETKNWMLGHVFLQNVMAKSPLLQQKFEDWKGHKDDGIRSLGWGCLGYLAKSKKMDDAYFPAHVKHISAQLQGEANFVKDSMNNALFAISQRSKSLYADGLAAAKSIGPVEVDYGENSCQALDVIKHLTSPRIAGKFA